MSDISAKEDSKGQTIQKEQEEIIKTKQPYDWQILTDSSDTRGYLYMAFEAPYLKKLMAESASVRLSPSKEDQYSEPKKIFGQQFSIYKKEFKGQAELLYNQTNGLVIRVKFQDKKVPYTTGWTKVHYKEDSEWKSKGFRIEGVSKKKEEVAASNLSSKKRKTRSSDHVSQYQLTIPSAQLTDYIEDYFLISIDFFKVSQGQDAEFVGIQNVGNTCYFNSIIQILYYIRPFRKIIIENTKQNRLLQNLQQLFCQLETTTIVGTADSIQVMRCFPHYNQYNPQQQDIQEFMINFFEDLEKQLPEVKQFWNGKGEYITRAKDKKVKYQSKQDDIFNQLDLHMTNHKGERFPTIVESLQSIVEQQEVEDFIEAEGLGRIEVTKTRFIQYLPSILFLNLKRYQFDQKRRSLSKILTEMSYPEKIDLSFLCGTPKCDKQSGLNYSLFALTVHKGRSPYHGHYYSFINTSEKLSKPKWYKFNDSAVEKAEIQKILKDYQGQKQRVVELNKFQCKWEEAEYDSDQTAYLLVYINDQTFQEFQKTKSKIPQTIAKKIQKKYKELEQQKIVDIRLLIMDPITQNNFNPFEEQMEYLPIPMDKSEDLMTQLKNLQTSFLCITIGTVWKVNAKKKTIKYCKCIGKNYGPDFKFTAERVGSYYQGHTSPDYLIIVPYQMSVKHVDNLSEENDLVMLQLNFKQGKNYEIISRDKFESYVEELKSEYKGQLKIHDELDRFSLKWNDFCVIDFQ